MDQQIVQLRDLFADKEALSKKRKALKEQALSHRDADEMSAAIDQVKAIDEQIRSIDDKIKKIQTESEENRKMDNNMLHFNDKMSRAEVLETLEYRDAFFKRLQGKQLNDEEQRAMDSTTAKDGAAIPTMTMNQIIGQVTENAPMLSLVSVLNIPELISLPKENVTTDANWVAEGSAATAGEDTLSVITLSAYKLIRTIEITAKLEAMSVDAFEAWIVATMSRKMRAALDAAIVNGTGTGQPTGFNASSITWDASNSVTVAKASALTYENVVDLEALVGEDYINNAVFVMNRKTLAAVMKLKDDNKRPLFERAVEDGFRGYLIGIPVKLDKNIADGEMLLGDFKAGYVMNFAKQIEFASSKEAGFASGNTIYRGLALVDGKPTGVAGAVVKMVKSST